MKLQNKIILICFAVAVLVVMVISFATDTWPGNGFCLMAGLTGMVGGAGYFGLGILLLLLKDKRYAKAVVLSGVILAVIGFILFKFLPQY